MKKENPKVNSIRRKRKKNLDNESIYSPKHCCPKQHPSPKLPSPTSCLPQEDLNKVVETIREANELLLDLALGEERPINETFQKVFDGLIGVRVKILGASGETCEGKVILSGSDFVVLQDEEKRFLYPYTQIDLVKPFGRFADPYHDPELEEVASCFRRELTFNFGCTVSSSPELLHLFFRISLSIYLLSLEGRLFLVQLDGQSIEGILKQVDKDSFRLEENEQIRNISLDQIQLLTLHD